MINKNKNKIPKITTKRKYRTFLDECLGITTRDTKKSERGKNRHGFIGS